MKFGLFDDISEQEKKQYGPVIDFIQSKKPLVIYGAGEVAYATAHFIIQL